jgi:hypothetical protein
MKTFKSITDVDRLRNDPAYSPLHATITPRRMAGVCPSSGAEQTFSRYK